MAIIGTIYGFLGDLVGTHVFLNGVPQALRRRWNLLGGFEVTDNEAQQWLEVTVTGGSTMVGAPDVSISGRDLALGMTRNAVMSAATTMRVDSEGTLNLGTNDADATNVGRADGATTIRGLVEPTDDDMPATKLYVDGIGGFNSQAQSPNVATTAVTAGTTTISRRAGQATAIGNTTGVITMTGSQFTLSAPSAGGATAITTSSAINCVAGTNLRLGAATACYLGTSDDGVNVMSPLIRVGGAPGSGTHAVEVRGRVTSVQGVVSTGLGVSTSPTTIAGSTVVIDSIRFDYERVTKAGATTLEAGKLNDLTSGTGWTLPALSGVADGESVYVVHPWATGDGAAIAAAGADTINGGDGHAADTSFALTEYQGRVRFQKVNSEWRVSAEGSANVPSGGGDTIAQSGGSVAVGASGEITATVTVGQDFIVQQGGVTVFGNDGGTGVTLVDADGSPVHIGTVSASEVAIGNAGASEVSTIVDGTGEIVEAVGSASRTATASGTARTETYAGALDVACATKHTTTCTGGEVEANCANFDVNASADVTIDGGNNVTCVAGNSFSSQCTGLNQMYSSAGTCQVYGVIATVTGTAAASITTGGTLTLTVGSLAITNAAVATITGNVTTGSLADLQGVVGQLLAALDAMGVVVDGTT